MKLLALIGFVVVVAFIIYGICALIDDTTRKPPKPPRWGR